MSIVFKICGNAIDLNQILYSLPYPCPGKGERSNLGKWEPIACVEVLQSFWWMAFMNGNKPWNLLKKPNGINLLALSRTSSYLFHIFPAVLFIQLSFSVLQLPVLSICWAQDSRSIGQSFVHCSFTEMFTRDVHSGCSILCSVFIYGNVCSRFLFGWHEGPNHFSLSHWTWTWI